MIRWLALFLVWVWPAWGQALVDSAWLETHLRDPGLRIVDVRDPDTPATDYSLAHIPGAVPAPFATFGWAEGGEGLPLDLAPRLGDLGIGPDSHVVLIADFLNAYEVAKATRAYWVLKGLGHDRVSILDGGQPAWEAAGLPVEAGESGSVLAEFVVAPRDGFALTTEEVQALIGQITLVDARTAKEYSGQRKVGAVARAGTIPGAVNLPHTRLVNGQFATADDIRAMMAEAGIPPDRPIVTFCNIGLWGALDWFALSEIAGMQARLYPGSMAAWAADPARPVR